LEHIFSNKLKVNPKKSNILIPESANNPKENRERLIQFMFETFDIAGFYLSSQAFLTLCTEGSSTGMVVGSGEGVTQFVPIYEGYTIPQAIIRMNLGGGDVNNYLEKIIFKEVEHPSIPEQKKRSIIKDIKEKACYVALNIDEELKSVKPYEFTLPDKTKVLIKEDRIKAPEALFNLSMIGKNDGIGEVCFNAFQKCDIDTKKELYNNIILSGGNTMFNGFRDRFAQEIKSMVPTSMKEEVYISESPERQYSSWQGGSILSSVSTFESNWITRKEYYEFGPDKVQEKIVQ
jgi:actin